MRQLCKLTFVILLLIQYLNSFSQTILPEGGTTIITLITKDSIVVAADSRQSNIDKPSLYTNVAKIREKNNVFYAMAGNLIKLNVENGKDTLDMYRLMDSAIMQEDNIDSIVNLFYRTAYRRYWDMVGGIAAKTVFEFQDKINDKAIQLEIVAFKNGFPIYKFYQLGFFKKEIPGLFKNLSLTPKFEYVEVKIDKKLPFIHLMGIYAEIQSDIDSLNYKSINLKTHFSNLIKKEIEAHPLLIGEPIDVVVIYPTHHKWLTNNRY